MKAKNAAVDSGTDAMTAKIRKHEHDVDVAIANASGASMAVVGAMIGSIAGLFATER